MPLRYILRFTLRCILRYTSGTPQGNLAKMILECSQDAPRVNACRILGPALTRVKNPKAFRKLSGSFLETILQRFRKLSGSFPEVSATLGSPPYPRPDYQIVVPS